MDNQLFSLSAQQIETLRSQGCRAQDWSLIKIGKSFDTARVHNVVFEGRVVIQGWDNEFNIGGVENARISNCNLGKNVLIRNVRNGIANYTIDDEVTITDVSQIEVIGDTAFGNGVKSSVANENGGRSILLHNRLSAQSAYIAAFYRHRPALLNALNKLIHKDIDAILSAAGYIEKGAVISSCGVIINVHIGAQTTLQGAARLENGTILSCPKDPAFVGTGVIAKDFIFCQGSRISDHVILNRCFVGQAAELLKGFTATDCVFFANSSFHQGECCSVFAGPFSVSHHKATLLIAATTSFFKAGSSTNQSNHMYKLGPGHQGILERGCKTGSGAYMLWPMRVGPFTTILGKHTSRADLTNLPYSILLEKDGKCSLIPAGNLVNIGLMRDLDKWPKRDARKTPEKKDRIIPAGLTPYTVQRIFAGIELLRSMVSKSKIETPVWQGIKIMAIETGIDIYQAAIDVYLAKRLCWWLDNCDLNSLLEPASNETESAGPWVDVAGLPTPQRQLEAVLQDLEQGHIDSTETLESRLDELHANYVNYEWKYLKRMVQHQTGKAFVDMTREDLAIVIERGLKADQMLFQLRLDDASKEFAPIVQTGFGLDGGSQERQADFDAVAGKPENNLFLVEHREKMTKFDRVAKKQIQLLRNHNP